MNTMYQKCAVAGDITQAIDRRGCWSVALCIIGGTESTAVKLQSCETAGGVFTDYLTLVSASEADADQYLGFVVDLYGAGKFIKVTGAKYATAVLGDCDHDVKGIAIKKGDVPQTYDLQNNKTATIDVSAYTEPVEITPTAGKDGMKKATVTLDNIPSGGVTTLYRWNDGSNNCYTTTPTPTTNDKALQISGEYASDLAWFDINSVTEEGIILYEGGNAFIHDPTGDISLT